MGVGCDQRAEPEPVVGGQRCERIETVKLRVATACHRER